MNERQTCEVALATYGETAQLDMVIEECAELIVAIQHWRRYRGSPNDLVSEIADVEIMCLQLRIMLDRDDEIDLMRAHKIKRLAQRLDRRFANEEKMVSTGAASNDQDQA